MTGAVAPSAEGQTEPEKFDRVEDHDLLTGRARFADDLAIRADCLHAAVLRSPHAHAAIVSIDVEAALAIPGVEAVLTGADVKAWARPFVVGVKQPMEHWCVALDRVRYVGEPVAIVAARDRYLAEDALDRIVVAYEPLPVVVDPVAAMGDGAPVLHEVVGSNVVSERRFSYGAPDAAFEAAAHRVGISVRYPRNSVTPMECFVVIAEYLPAAETYDVLANFQGPFALHPVMAMALKVPGHRLRLRTPPSAGGSFGVKQGVFPYVVSIGLLARKAGRPVKWTEDRLEHLVAANSATGRVTTIEAAVTGEGAVTALRYDQTDDCGAYLRAPEPATLYRMHGNLSGAYKMRNIAVTNRVVLTNKTPSGLNRGFGGPQLYFALERLMHRIAVELGLDPLDVIRRNLVSRDAFPYRTPSGALLDSGDYAGAIALGVGRGDLDALKARQEAARAEGRLYGIGFAAVVEPSVSNMGYITTVLTPEERHKVGAKSGAQASATVSVDPMGSVTVTTASTPQGQGHATVLARVVGAVLGLPPERIVVNTELDTQKDAWSIASGNYSSRFAPAVAGAAHLAAIRLRDKLVRIAAAQLNVPTEAVRFADGKIHAEGNPDNALAFHRVAGTSHWSVHALPDGAAPALRETAFWSPPQLAPPNDADEINSSGAYGFIFDLCGIEVDRATGRVCIDRYVTTHDAGRILDRAAIDGQVRGGFSNAIGAALYEAFIYREDGSFLSGTFADYLVPTVHEVPEPLIVHQETPSPFTPLGAKGAGEGNTMSTPVCIANAVADALGISDIVLPLTPPRVAALLQGEETPSRTISMDEPSMSGTGGAVVGKGEVLLTVAPEIVWRALLDPEVLAAAVPGCRRLETVGENSFAGEADIGVGPIRGRFGGTVALLDLDPPRALTLAGAVTGPLGAGRGRGHVTLTATPEGTRLAYDYEVSVSGKVAAVGGRLLESASRVLIGRFFTGLAKRLGAPQPATTWFAKLLRWLGPRR